MSELPNWPELMKFFTELTNRQEVKFTAALEAHRAQILGELKTFSMERERAFLERFNQIDKTTQEHAYKLTDIGRRTERLFVLTDDVKDSISPAVQRLSSRLAEVEQKLSERTCVLHGDKLRALEEANNNKAAEKRGIGKVGHWIWAGISVIVMLISLAVGAKNLTASPAAQHTPPAAHTSAP